jgi:tRNA pseudouridine32 synthase/23S rRNA pseudouridine746 synthase
MSLLDVIFADEHLVVLNKPSGLLSVPGRGEDKQDCLIARAQAEWSEALTVHRLDMATSGLMVIARGSEMQRKLSQAFAQRDVHKTYEAIVAGSMQAKESNNSEAWHDIQMPLLIDWPNRPKSKIDWEHGKPSHTQWRVKSSNSENTHFKNTTRVELQPITGRTHQLRLHMMAMGHAILGDTLYASPDIQAQSPRLLLHARSLQFKHPVKAEWMSFESTVPF